MTTVTVSPKFQVVIPSHARKLLGIESGQKVEVLVYEGRLEYIPVKPPELMQGFLNGIETDIPRDKDRI